MKSTKRSLFTSALALFLCFSMLLGTTFAWFTDTVTSGNNKIVSGSLKVDLELFDKETGTWESIKNSQKAIFDHKNWEPGYTDVKVLRITNKGSLALKWDATIIPLDELTALADVIDVYVYSGKTAPNARPGRNDLEAEGYHKVGTLREFAEGLDTESASALLAGESDYLGVALKMRESAGNEYKNTSCGEFDIRIVATQYSAENEKDSFDENYDNEAQFPVFKPADVNLSVQTANGFVTADAYKKTGSASMKALAGTKVTDDRLSLNVSEMAASGSNVQLEENEAILPLDVHVDGVAADNTKPIIITLDEAMMTGLNIGNYKLYHVEDGVANLMTAVSSLDELDAHNEFYYDPATGNVSLAMATFSEVAMVAEPAKWEGELDYEWYKNSTTETINEKETTVYTIANADQLAGLSAIVGGMDGQTQDSFAGKTVKLTSDINLGDKESENNPNIIFYPIGYYNSEGTYERSNTAITSGLRNFEGTFDGNGHTVSNFYHNTWEMKGDHDWYDATLQYYRDGMGLFGRVYKGTVKNLTVKNFSSDGEIATTGVIAAYADGATFENIAIFNCNPRVYNIGNGGIVGCVGWYAKEAGLKTTFTNITVDNSNKISALWGSYDVACGGIVGQYYPTSGQSSANYPVNAGIDFVNCHISAQMDVYNDVCANYQYYAYRYTGMLIGSVRENVTVDGKSYPKMDNIEAKNCTVHFGTWNDYYYCEIIDNTTASYTHDYQMSRLTQVEKINTDTKKYLPLGKEDTDENWLNIPTSGWAHYVVVNGEHASENATCYHFKDGAVWNHEDAGYHNGENGEKYIDENGDGKADLKEDKQHIYLEFNNLVTGYGWGVTSKGLEDFKGVTNLDITEGDHEASVKKFESDKDALTTNRKYTIGEIFSYIENCGVKVVNGAVSVTITNLDENGNVIATFTRGEKWNEGTISFENTGNIAITIQDYYFCTPTTIEVTVTDRQPEVKFDVVMNNGDFLHRVGNSGTVALDKLFKAKDGVTVGTVSVTVEAVDGTGASGTYSNNAIQFSGTGVVKVTITDNDYCTPTELYLEVVDAVNATGATNATSNNVVLLQDCGFSSLEVSGGYALYGNGFTMTCGSDSYAADMGYAFVTLSNGTLDNVQIVCPNFDYAALYKGNLTSSDNRSYTDSTGKTRYYNARSGVMVSGNSQILNSRISGARAAVNVTAGNCVIDNSRIELGAVASLLVGAANSVILRDVTLVQKPTASTYDSSKTLMGFSVLVMCTSGGTAAPITLEGTLVQNAWVDENDKQYVPSDAQSIIDEVMAKDDYLHDLDEDGVKESLNLGIAYMPADGEYTVQTPAIFDNRTNNGDIPYESVDVKYSLVTTYVYSYKNTNGTADSFKTESEYVPNKYSDIIAVSYSDTTDGLTIEKTYGTNGWVYELNVDLDTASGYALDFSKLSMSVNGVAVADFLVNGSAKPTSPVAVVAGGTTYVLTTTVDGKEYTATLKVTGTETSKHAPSIIASTYDDCLLVGEKGTSTTWSAAAPALVGIQIKYWSVAEKQYKTVTLSDYTPATNGQQNGTNTSWTYTAANNDFTLTITNTAAVHSGEGVYAMPVVCNSKLYFVITSSKGLVSTSSGTRNVTLKYVFEDNNNGKIEFTNTFSASYNSSATLYDYSDFCNGNLKEASGPCVTPDTLVTLADGTQVRVDALTGNEMLLVWNHQTGTMESVPVAYIVNHDGVASECEVISLNFSNGRTVKIIGEHVFFDATLNKYVAITSENANDFIGHKFAAIGADGNALEMVELSSIDRTIEITTVYEVVSYKHLTCFTEGILSTSAYLDPLLNVFDINEDTLTYDAELVQSDIEKYGLYTYADFEGLISEEAFELYNAAYLKIAVGKGYITWDDILELIDIYFAADVQPV